MLSTASRHLAYLTGRSPQLEVARARTFHQPIRGTRSRFRVSDRPWLPRQAGEKGWVGHRTAKDHRQADVNGRIGGYEAPTALGRLGLGNRRNVAKERAFRVSAAQHTGAVPVSPALQAELLEVAVRLRKMGAHLLQQLGPSRGLRLGEPSGRAAEEMSLLPSDRLEGRHTLLGQLQTDLASITLGGSPNHQPVTHHSVDDLTDCRFGYPEKPRDLA
jgi:hypothetical protein